MDVIKFELSKSARREDLLSFHDKHRNILLIIKQKKLQ